MRACLLLGLVSVAIACGSSSDDAKPGDDGASSGSIGGIGGDGGIEPEEGCPLAAQLVYVVSAQDDLYSFRPDKKQFMKVGQLSCPAAMGATPNSMAIDRSGVAWINYSDGTLFKASTSTASCTATDFVANQGNGFSKFGMAFATRGAKSKSETLFISGLDSGNAQVGHGFGVIDTNSLELTMLGDFSGELKGRAAELTGTGDGKLFGFFTTEPATVAQINGASGATTETTQLANVDAGHSYAFSFWGGDFWFYTSDGTAPSKVTRLARSADDAVSVVMDDVGGFRIVGAGVSTCAPIAPPK